MSPAGGLVEGDHESYPIDLPRCCHMQSFCLWHVYHSSLRFLTYYIAVCIFFLSELYLKIYHSSSLTCSTALHRKFMIGDGVLSPLSKHCTSKVLGIKEEASTALYNFSLDRRYLIRAFTHFLDNFHEDFAHASLLNKIAEVLCTEEASSLVSENLLSCLYNITMNSMYSRY